MAGLYLTTSTTPLSSPAGQVALRPQVTHGFAFSVKNRFNNQLFVSETFTSKQIIKKKHEAEHQEHALCQVSNPDLLAGNPL